MLISKNKRKFDENQSLEKSSSKFILKTIATLPLLLAFGIEAQVNGQLRDLSSNTPSNFASFKIPTAAEWPTSEDEGKKVALSKIKLVTRRFVQGNKLSSNAATDDRVISLIDNAMSEKGGAFSMSELKTLSDQISAKYREVGYLLSTAYIPVQEVVDGVLIIEVLQGVLGDVVVSGNSEYADDLFKNEFAKLGGKVVMTDEAEKALLLVQKRIAGASTVGIFGPGSEVGLSDLEINVATEDTFKAVTFVDNYGSAYTGELRAGVHLENYNTFGFNDNLILDLVANEKPDGVDDSGSICCFGGIKYEFFGDDLTNSYGVEFSRSTYDVGNARFLFSNLGLEGESHKLRLFGTRILQLSRSSQLTLDYGISNIVAESTSARIQDSNLPGSRDEIGEFDLGLSYSFFGSGVTFGDVSIHTKPNPDDGSFIDELLTITGYDDDVYEGDSAPSPTRDGTLINRATIRFLAEVNHVQRLWNDFSVHLKVNGQYSGDPLAPIQQFGLAGPGAVRFLETGVFLGDTTVISSVDLSYTKYSGDWRLSPSVFFDYGYARQNSIDLSSNDKIDSRSVNAFGMGLGFKANYGQNMELSVTYAFDLSDMEESDVLAQSSSDEDFDNHFYASIVYRF